MLGRGIQTEEKKKGAGLRGSVGPRETTAKQNVSFLHLWQGTVRSCHVRPREVEINPERPCALLAASEGKRQTARGLRARRAPGFLFPLLLWIKSSGVPLGI